MSDDFLKIMGWLNNVKPPCRDFLETGKGGSERELRVFL
jgi:hypothetical protein